MVVWSEEIFNCFLSLLNQKSSSHYLFDTLITTKLFTTLLRNPEAQKALVASKGNTYRQYLFPVLNEGGYLTMYLVTPEEKQLTIFSNQASKIDQGIINSIIEIFSNEGEQFNITEISENLRVLEVGVIKICARIETIVNNLSPEDAKSEANMREVLINSFMFGHLIE